MTEPEGRLEERELERRRENEKKDLEVENTHGERPLEGFSQAPTTWTEEQDDSQRSIHENDEAASQRASRAQVPPPPGADEQ